MAQADAHGAELAVFQPPIIETGINKETYIEYRPTGNISKGSIIEFTVPANSANYLNLKKTRLLVKIKIIHPDGKTVNKDDPVSLINLSLESLFRQVDVMLNQKVVSSDVGVNYPYKSMLDVLLTYNHDVKESVLQGALYYKDTSGAMDATDPQTGEYIYNVFINDFNKRTTLYLKVNHTQNNIKRNRNKFTTE